MNVVLGKRSVLEERVTLHQYEHRVDHRQHDRLFSFDRVRFLRERFFFTASSKKKENLFVTNHAVLRLGY